MIEKKELKKSVVNYRTQQKELIEERRKTVRSGDNVVHITYYENVLSGDDLKKYSISLEEVNLEISSFNPSGIIFALSEDWTNVMNIALGSELTKNIVYGVAGNIVWDTIKKITKKIFIKTKNKSINKISGGIITEKAITFGINFSLDKNTGFTFRLDSKLTSQSVDKALEQATEFVKEQNANKTYTHPTFLYYDKKKKEWIAVDVMEEIRKKAAKRKPVAVKKEKIAKIKGISKRKK